MTQQHTAKVGWKPGQYRVIDPYIVVKGAAGFIDFLKAAFNATEDMRVPNPDGTIGHAEVRVGDAVLLMFDSRDKWPATPAFLRIYVEDADRAYEAAIKAGGVSVTDLMDSFLGERGGRVRDPFGNVWWIISRIEELTPEEIGKRAGEEKYMKGMKIAEETFDKEMRSRA